MNVVVVCHKNDIVFSDLLILINKEIRYKYLESSVNLVLICDTKLRYQTFLQYLLIEFKDLFRIIMDFFYSLLKDYKSRYDNVSYVYDKKAFLDSLDDAQTVYMITSKYIVPKSITDKIDVFNFHCGLLPNYRGLFPTFWAYMENNSLGITLHKVDDKIDEGVVIGNVKLESNNISYYYSLKCLYRSGILLINNPQNTAILNNCMLKYYSLPSIYEIFKYRLKRLVDFS